MTKQRVLFRGIAVCLSHFSYYCIPSSSLYLSHPLILLLSLLFRTDHVLVGRGRRRCPSAAVCQRKRSAVLLIASTRWWVSYRETLYIKYKLYIAIHEIFKVPCTHQGFLEDQSLTFSIAEVDGALPWKSEWLTRSGFQVEGSELKKIRPNSRVYQRYYLLDAGLQALCWEPSKKESDKARISLASIREVSVQGTEKPF